MSRVYAYPAGDLPEGEALRFDTSPVIVLFNVGDESYTINGRCSHGNISTLEGHLEDDATMECPLYAASLCLRTGKALCLLTIGPLITYAVYVDGSGVSVNISEDAR